MQGVFLANTDGFCECGDVGDVMCEFLLVLIHTGVPQTDTALLMGTHEDDATVCIGSSNCLPCEFCSQAGQTRLFPSPRHALRQVDARLPGSPVTVGIKSVALHACMRTVSTCGAVPAAGFTR